MNPATPRYEWNTVPWPRLEAQVFKLQKRIYQASQRGDVKGLHRLQKLLLHSRSAKLLAVRRVTQDNRGRKTAGVDGLADLNPTQRLTLATRLTLDAKAQPLRRVWIPKPGKHEKRPLGIPTLQNRAQQTLVKMVLEPEWEAKFEPNSYGFRPGRSCHDAIEAIFGGLKGKKAYVLDADISGCFDNIGHQPLLAKLNTSSSLRKVIRGWLRAGIMDDGVFHKTDRGTPQGGTASPLLANIALHGLEDETKAALAADLFNDMKEKHGQASHYLAQKKISIVRYADDFVVFHENKAIVHKAKTFISHWLRNIGLELHPLKTRMTHTMEAHDGNPPGFHFLGFTVRHFHANNNKQGFRLLIKPNREGEKRHLHAIRQTLRHMRGAPQDAVIRQLNPMIKGWSRYYSSVVSSAIFSHLDHRMHQKLWCWATFRHSEKGKRWVKRKYFRTLGNDRWRFMTHQGQYLSRHSDSAIKRHIKVQKTRSPFDGDVIYWATRLGRMPGTSPRIAKLLKRQQGRCRQCHRWFQSDDVLEVHHQDHNRHNNKLENLGLYHRHCHHSIHARGMHDKH